MRHTLIKNFTVWYLNSGRTWVGKEETHQLTLGTQWLVQTKISQISFQRVKLCDVAYMLQRCRIYISGEPSLLCQDILCKQYIACALLKKIYSMCLSLSECALLLVGNHLILFMQASFHRLLKKQCGNRAAWEYPFAVAGVNITFMIMQMLDLQSSKHRPESPMSSCYGYKNVVFLTRC